MLTPLPREPTLPQHTFGTQLPLSSPASPPKQPSPNLKETSDRGGGLHHRSSKPSFPWLLPTPTPASLFWATELGGYEFHGTCQNCVWTGGSQLHQPGPLGQSTMLESQLSTQFRG